MITLSKQTKREPLLPTLHKLYDTIQDAFNSEYLNTFEDIILLSQNAFLTAVSANAMKYLHDVYQHNELFSTFAKETIKQIQNEIHMQYIMHYTSLSNAFKKYSTSYNNKVNYLTLYRRHCPFTDEVPCHNCINKEEYANGNVNNNNNNKYSLIEVKPIIQDKQITFVICTLCKKCFFANRILLWCRNCKCEYYSSLLGENEQFNLLPATWERYHCRNTINDTMKCIQCKSVFYLNLITKKLECSNSKCALVIDPHSILWNCIFCKQDFSSEARIFNPLEVNLIKQSINKAIIRQIKVYPHKLPCCVCSDIKMLKFYHKKTCKGQLYEGMFNHNKIVVCSKCNAMNFYDKFIWTCPLCNVRFRSCESKGSSIVDSIRKSSDSFYSMFDKRNASTITSSPTVNKGNASLSLLSSHLLNTSSILNLNKTTSNYNYDGNKCKGVDSNSNNNNNNSNNRRIPLSSVSSTNNSARVVLNLNNINKREPCYSTLIDIMKRRNFAQKFAQFSYSSSLSSNHSVLRGKALSRTESTIKNCIDNKSKSKTTTSNNNTSSTKQDNITNTPNNHILTSNITKFHNANLSQRASSGRNTSDSSYKSIPPKIIKRPKKIAINLFESFNKAEEENDIHPLSTKARMFANNNINYNITLFDSPLTGKNKRVNGISSTRNTFYEHNSNSKEDTIRHIYQLRSKNFNAYSNLKTHSKGLTGSSGNVHNNNKTNIPNSKMILINKQQKRTNKLTYKGVNSDKIKEQDSKQQGMMHYSVQNVNTKQIDNTIESHRENEKSNSQSTTTTTKRVGMPSMEQQSSILLNEILSTSIIPFFNIENFKLLNPIGEGSYGKIYCIEDSLSKSKYALKKIIAHDIQEVKTYQTEFELVYSYTHPNIMKIYNIQYKCLDFSTFSIYVLMELASCDWNVEIKRKIENKTSYKESELIIMLYSLIKALSFLQKKNIAHRDIKPQNILLYPNNKVKVADFGEAKEIKIIKQQNTLKGTEMYMSPILYNAVKYNKKNVEHNVYKSDVFSLGFCFLYAAALNFKILSDLREIKDMKEIRIKIGKYLNKRYSSKLINAIIKMVEYNENERVDFIEMEKYIKDNLN